MLLSMHFQGPMGMRGESGPSGPAGKAGIPVSDSLMNPLTSSLFIGVLKCFGFLFGFYVATKFVVDHLGLVIFVL